MNNSTADTPSNACTHFRRSARRPPINVVLLELQTEIDFIGANSRHARFAIRVLILCNSSDAKVRFDQVFVADVTL